MNPAFDGGAYEVAGPKDKIMFVDPDIALPPELQNGHEGSHLYLKLLELISKRIANALKSTLPVRSIQDGQRMVLLDQISWVVDHSMKELRQEVRDEEQEWRDTGLVFDIRSPLNTSEWIGYVVKPVLAELQLRIPSTATGSLFNWLKRNLEIRFQNSEWLDPVREQVFQHCQVMPGLCQAVTEIYSLTERRIVNSETYSQFWANAPAWSGFIDEAPQLLHFYYWYKEYFALPVGDGLGAVREDCLEDLWQPGTWRFLAGHGRKCYEDFYQPHLPHNQNFFNFLGFIGMQKHAELDEPLPTDLARVLGSVLQTIDTDSMQIDPRILRIGASKWKEENLKGNGKQFAESDWLEILVWMRDEQPSFDKNQWRAGWNAIWRQFQLRREDTGAFRQWGSLISEFVIDQWRVVPLVDELSLAQEGLAMKNCVGTVADCCIAGTYQIFSIADMTTNARLATVALVKKSEKWTVEQVKGKCNSEVDGAIEHVARVILERYNEEELALVLTFNPEEPLVKSESGG